MKDSLNFNEALNLLRLGIPENIASVKANGYVGEPPIFKTGDLISILPNQILFDENENSILELRIEWSSALYKWVVGYYAVFDQYRGIQFTYKSEELIDALYELLVWTIEQKHVKL